MSRHHSNLLVRFFPFALLFFFNAPIQLFAQMEEIGNWSYIENKGQIVDQDGNPNPAVRYLFNGNGLNLQLLNEGFAYDTWRKDTQTGKYIFHRIEVEFLGVNPDLEIETFLFPEGNLNWYTGNNWPEGLTAQSHHYIQYKNLYEGVDLVFRIEKDEKEQVFYPKYEFILAEPQTHGPEQIKMRFKGTDNVRLKNPTAILIPTIHGPLLDTMPESYTTWKKLVRRGGCSGYVGGEIPAQVEFVQEGENTISFNLVEAQFKNGPLVIDPVPTRRWGTYVGGSAADRIHDLTIAPNGDVVACGSTESPLNIATSGAWKDTLSGNRDAFIARFDTSGNRLWVTYVGGDSLEEGLGITTARNGDYLFCGNTNSPTGISTTGTAQTSINGPSDGMIMRFDGNGTLIWGSYFGGSGAETLTDVKMDAGQEILITGRTTSNNFPTTASAHQTSSGGGSSDGIIACLDSTGGLNWSSYYGGNGADILNALTVDPVKGDIYATGQTGSTNNISTIGSHQAAIKGNTDAMFLKFTSSGTLLYGSYFGDSIEEAGMDIVFAPVEQRIYHCGYTTSPNWGHPVGAWQPAYGGGATDAFLTYWDTSGVVRWSTYYGGAGADTLEKIITDPNDFIIAAGQTDSDSSIASQDGYQVTRGGLTDNFMIKMDRDNQVIWGTYYGGSDLETDAALGYIPASTAIALGATTQSPDSIFSQSAFQVINGGQTDGYLAYFDDCLELLTPTLINPTVSLCADTTPILYTLQPVNGATNYTWTFPTGWTVVSGQGTDSIRVRPGNSGPLQVTASSGCDTSLALTQNLVVNPLPTVTASNDTSICFADTVFLSASGASTYSWSPGFTLNDSTSSNPLGLPLSTVTYTVTGTDANGCTDTDDVTVTVFPLTVFNLGTQRLCQGDTLTILQGPPGTYSWSPNLFLSDPNSPAPRFWPPFTQNYTLTYTSPFGCQTIENFTILVTPLIGAQTIPDTAICEGASVTLNSTPGGIFYTWSPSTGLTNPNVPGPTATPSVTTTYNLTILDGNGCTDTASVTITVNQNPPVPVITQVGATLESTPSASYQWFQSGTPIAGATMQMYTPTQSGNYAVMITDQNGCSSMSMNFAYTFVGLDTEAWTGIQVWPNPARNEINIAGLNENLDAELLNPLGQSVVEKTRLIGAGRLEIKGLPQGLYFLRLTNEKGREKVFRIVKE